MQTDLHFSSQSVEWSTPRDMYARLHQRWQFTLDPCCTKENCVPGVQKFFTAEQDGLSQPWDGHRVFMNPPYGRGIDAWIKKAHSQMRSALIVALLPHRTDTSWYHTWIYKRPGVFVDELRGRLKFGGHENPAPFPSALVYFLGQ